MGHIDRHSSVWDAPCGVHRPPFQSAGCSMWGTSTAIPTRGGLDMGYIDHFPACAELDVGYIDHHFDVRDAPCGVQRTLSVPNSLLKTPCPLLYASSFGVETVCRKRDNEQVHHILCDFHSLMREN